MAALCLVVSPAVTLAHPVEGAGRVAPQVRLDVRVVTVYHLAVEETDSEPFATADGTRIYSTDQRIAALSREMLARWGGSVSYGDMIWVEVPDSSLSGLWTVRDTMATKVYRSGVWEPVVGYVDLLVSEDVMGYWDDNAEIDVSLVRW